MSRADKMWASVYLAPQQLEYQQIDIPVVSDGEILVRINRALTCGTDVKTFRRGHPKIPPPTVFGHEFAGEIVSVGEGVEKFKPGQRIVSANTAPCNLCYFCKRGQHNLCENIIMNLGAFAEYIRVPAPIVQQNTFLLPDSLPDEVAAATEPLGCVVHGQDLLDIQPGESVAIVGAGGPIGLMHLQLALKQGASPVIAIDLSDNRLEIASQLGASEIINPTKHDALESVRARTNGRGVDVAIESAGDLDAWSMAVNLVRKGGRIQWFGGLPSGTEISLDTVRVHYDELTIFGVYHATPLTFERAFNMILEGVVDIRSLITGELPLSKLEDALTMMSKGECIKMSIIPK